MWIILVAVICNGFLKAPTDQITQLHTMYATGHKSHTIAEACNFITKNNTIASSILDSTYWHIKVGIRSGLFHSNLIKFGLRLFCYQMLLWLGQHRRTLLTSWSNKLCNWGELESFFLIGLFVRAGVTISKVSPIFVYKGVTFSNILFCNKAIIKSLY